MYGFLFILQLQVGAKQWNDWFEHNTADLNISTTTAWITMNIHDLGNLLTFYIVSLWGWHFCFLVKYVHGDWYWSVRRHLYKRQNTNKCFKCLEKICWEVILLHIMRYNDTVGVCDDYITYLKSIHNNYVFWFVGTCKWVCRVKKDSTITHVEAMETGVGFMFSFVCRWPILTCVLLADTWWSRKCLWVT